MPLKALGKGQDVNPAVSPLSWTLPSLSLTNPPGSLDEPPPPSLQGGGDQVGGLSGAGALVD